MAKSPRQVRRDLQEAVTEQVRDLPIHAVRLAMFGVGRALLLSDRVTRDYKELRESGPGPVLDRLRGDAKTLSEQVVHKVFNNTPDEPAKPAEPVRRPARRAPEARETPVARPPRRTPNGAEPGRAPNGEISVGKPKPEATPTPTPKPAAKPAPTPKAADAIETAEAIPVPEQVKAPDVEPVLAAATADLPVPNYADATLASVRARLRTLTPAQVSKLRDYEVAHANRPDFVRMFENRLAKLAAES